MEGVEREIILFENPQYSLDDDDTETRTFL